MRLTGQKKNLLISALGAGNYIVLGLEQRNQHDIIEAAHDDKIVQIVSLGGSKLEDKYFATRCVDGDVSIWSATSHPDRVFTIENVDQDETAPAQADTNRESAKEEPVPEKTEEPAAEEGEGEAEAEEEEEMDEDGNPIPKKKVEVVKVKKDKSGRISSKHDCMLEIKWNQSVLQGSATILMFSNYNEAFVMIAMIDLKTSRMNKLKTFKLSNKPTKMYQIDENNILVGTEGGKIEHW